MDDFMVQEIEGPVGITNMNMKDSITFRSSHNDEMLKISQQYNKTVAPCQI
jgi:hypothetical protein